MRQTRLALAFGLLLGVAALGCGLDSPKDTGPAGILASCGYPTCFLDVVVPCLSDGTCVEQDTATCGASACPTPLTGLPTAETISTCCSNGVKMLEEIDMSNYPPVMAMTSTMKKGSTVCYSVTGTYSNGVSSYSLKNGAGAPVATVVGDTTARTMTITCTGGSPAVVSLDCLNPDGGTSSGSSSSCTQGTCVF